MTDLPVRGPPRSGWRCPNPGPGRTRPITSAGSRSVPAPRWARDRRCRSRRGGSPGGRARVRCRGHRLRPDAVAAGGNGFQGDRHRQPLPRMAPTRYGCSPASMPTSTCCARALDHLQVPEAIIVGHSMGGRLVAELVAAEPDRAIAVVLVNAIVGGRWDRIARRWPRHRSVTSAWVPCCLPMCRHTSLAGGPRSSPPNWRG